MTQIVWSARRPSTSLVDGRYSQDVDVVLHVDVRKVWEYDQLAAQEPHRVGMNMYCKHFEHMKRDPVPSSRHDPPSIASSRNPRYRAVLLTEPDLLPIALTSQTDDTAVVPQLARSDIVNVFIGRVDLAFCAVNLELIHLGISVHGSSSGEGVSSHLSRQLWSHGRWREAYMSVGLGSDVDTGVTGSHTPEDVRVPFLYIVSE